MSLTGGPVALGRMRSSHRELDDEQSAARRPVRLDRPTQPLKLKSDSIQ